MTYRYGMDLKVQENIQASEDRRSNGPPMVKGPAYQDFLQEISRSLRIGIDIGQERLSWRRHSRVILRQGSNREAQFD